MYVLNNYMKHRILYKLVFLYISLFPVSLYLNAQKNIPDQTELDDTELSFITDNPACWPGCGDCMSDSGYQCFNKNLRSLLDSVIHYPDSARKYHITGKVYGQFTVETDGTITDIKIIRGVGYGCDEEVINALKKIPTLIPSTMAGKPVKSRYTIPVYFKPEDD